MDLGYRPLAYFWVAEYEDGTALPQFDPETGKENLFRYVDQTRLKRFGWYPFSESMAQKIFKENGLVVIPTNLSSHVIELKKEEKLIAKRENTIQYIPLTGEVVERKIVYILGVENGVINRIREDGSIEE